MVVCKFSAQDSKPHCNGLYDQNEILADDEREFWVEISSVYRLSCLVDFSMCLEVVLHNAPTESRLLTWYTATTRGLTAGIRSHQCCHVEHTSLLVLSATICMPSVASSKTVALRRQSATTRIPTTGNWFHQCRQPITRMQEPSMPAGCTSLADILTTTSHQISNALTQANGRTWHQCWLQEDGM